MNSKFNINLTELTVPSAQIEQNKKPLASKASRKLESKLNLSKAIELRKQLKLIIDETAYLLAYHKCKDLTPEKINEYLPELQTQYTALINGFLNALGEYAKKNADKSYEPSFTTVSKEQAFHGTLKKHLVKEGFDINPNDHLELFSIISATLQQESYPRVHVTDGKISLNPDINDKDPQTPRSFMLGILKLELESKDLTIIPKDRSASR